MKTKLIVLGFVVFLGFSLLSGCSKNIDPQDKVIKTETQKAIAMLQAVYDRAEKDGLTLEQAKKIGADKLRALRYGPDNQGYFWADTVSGVNVVLYGRKDTEGRNRYNDNINGIYYVKELIAQGQQPNGGYTDYYFSKMGQKKPIKKRSYSLLFKPFGWVIGTGYYPEETQDK